MKLRLLTAEVLLREERARNAGGVTLPSIRVGRGFRIGLQLLRASINGATGAMYADLSATLGDRATREVLDRVERWWDGVYVAACQSFFDGLARELPQWGRDFHGRWVRLHRGNFPDRLYPGEPLPPAENSADA